MSNILSYAIIEPLWSKSNQDIPDDILRTATTKLTNPLGQNLCFLNALVHVLFRCPPIYWFFHTLTTNKGTDGKTLMSLLTNDDDGSRPMMSFLNHVYTKYYHNDNNNDTNFVMTEFRANGNFGEQKQVSNGTYDYGASQDLYAKICIKLKEELPNEVYIHDLFYLKDNNHIQHLLHFTTPDTVQTDIINKIKELNYPRMAVLCGNGNFTTNMCPPMVYTDYFTYRLTGTCIGGRSVYNHFIADIIQWSSSTNIHMYLNDAHNPTNITPPDNSLDCAVYYRYYQLEQAPKYDTPIFEILSAACNIFTPVFLDEKDQCAPQTDTTTKVITSEVFSDDEFTSSNIHTKMNKLLESKTPLYNFTNIAAAILIFSKEIVKLSSGNITTFAEIAKCMEHGLSRWCFTTESKAVVTATKTTVDDTNLNPKQFFDHLFVVVVSHMRTIIDEQISRINNAFNSDLTSLLSSVYDASMLTKLQTAKQPLEVANMDYANVVFIARTVATNLREWTDAINDMINKLSKQIHVILQSSPEENNNEIVWQLLRFLNEIKQWKPCVENGKIQSLIDWCNDQLKPPK